MDRPALGAAVPRTGAAPNHSVIWNLHRFASVGSTNDLAMAAAQDGAGEGLVILSDVQTRGRGRLGSGWSSPRGNLYCSILLRPRADRTDVGTMSFVVAVALADAIEAVTGLAVHLKWPNDVLIGGGKVAGLLLERGNGRDPADSWLVIGCGLNIAEAPPVISGNWPPTSLNEHGTKPDIDQMTTAYLDCLDRRYADWRAYGFPAVRETWISRAIGIGEDVQVRLPSETLAGRFAGIAQDGALLLADAVGAVRPIRAGSVFFAGSC